MVPTDGRGSLPFALLDGEPLVSIATAALASTGVELLDFTTPWSAVVSAGASLVVHDPLCPATPASFLASVVSSARPDGPLLVGVRPVTDTVKEISGSPQSGAPGGSAGVVGETVDRSGLVSLASPVVLPSGVVAALPDWPDLTDLPALVASLGERFEVSLVEAPAEGRRVVDESDLRLLAADTREQ